jgi:xanthine/uracil permease
MSRHVGFLAGSIMCVIAFVPAIPALIVFTPPPVIGAMLVYTAAFMIVAGMDLILSRLLNMKRTITVGPQTYRITVTGSLSEILHLVGQFRGQTFIVLGAVGAMLAIIVLALLFDTFFNLLSKLTTPRGIRD